MNKIKEWLLVKFDKDKAMNPYVAGALTGLLIILSVLVSGNYFGTSTSFVQLIAILENTIAPERMAQIRYFTIVDPVWSWQIFFVMGILLGSFATAKIFGEFKWQSIPDLWRDNLGSSKYKRMILAFLGGIIAMIGARLAGGCPSGQMSALILLSVSGLAAMTMFFIGGIVAARLIYGGGEK